MPTETKKVDVHDLRSALELLKTVPGNSLKPMNL